MLRQNKILFALVVSLILGIVSSFRADLSAHAQTSPQPIPHFTHLTISDGLPNNTIYAIHQDSQGFMWFGTNDGLSRYDGYRFVTYKNDRDDPDSISSNRVQAIFEDANGYLWIGTWDGGVSRFDSKTETFTNYRAEPDNTNSLLFDAVLAITQDSNNHFWFGGPPELGLSHFNPASETFTHYQPGIDYQGEGIEDLAADEVGGVWLATNEGVSRFENGQFRHYLLPTSNQRIYSILRDNAGQWWFGGESGLYRFDPALDQLIPVSGSPFLIHALLEDQQGSMWVGTSSGLYLFDPHQESWQLFAQHEPLFADSLSRNIILSLYEDAAGNIWAGTDDGGLNLFDPQQMQFANYRHDPTNENSLAEGTVSSVAGDGERIWLGTEAVLNEWENGRFDKLSADRFHHHQLPAESGLITALQSSQNGGVWVGTDKPQIFYFDPTADEFIPYPLTIVEAPPEMGAVLTPITAIVEDSSGIVWVAVLRDGLHRIDPADGNNTVFRAIGGGPGLFVTDPQSIGNRLVNELALAADGTIWIGYESPGISQLDPQTNTFTHYFSQAEIDPSQTEFGPVEALYPAPDGLVWAAARWGLAKLDPQTETAVLYTEADGLPSNFTVDVLSDKQGDLWVSTINGLARFDPQSETFQQYGRSDGLLTEDFSPRATWQGEDGRIYLGSSAGITAFYPEQISLDPYLPPVVFTELRLFNEPVPIRADSLLPQAIEQTRQITLNYDDDVISFEFAALSFSAPEENRYRYQLEGLEENWNEVGSDRRFATYTHLDAGDYTLRVQGSNKAGVWNEAATSLQITVLPPWWETNWFRLLAGVSFIALVFGLFRWRVWRIEQRNRELEAAVARQTAVIREAEAQKQRLAILEERQRIGRDLHDDLGQVIGYISVQSQTALVQLPPTEEVQQTRDSLTRLIQVAQEAHADVRQYILGIRTGAKREPTAFVPALKEYLQTLETISDFRTILSLPPQWEDSPCAPDVETQLLRIIQESLTNARKHAGTNEAHLIFTDHDDVIQVIISDKGKGFDPLAINRNPSTDYGPRTTGYRLRTTNYGLQNTGHFGLNIMRERVGKVGGHLDIRSAPGEGTQIIVRVPKQLEIGDPETAVSGLRVMLVDDHQLYLEGIQNLLRTRGIQVIGTANNGLEAQDKAAMLQPDLILMDVDMPICDGLEATRQIKQQCPDIKIVMLTVSAEEEKLLTALRYGASGYLLKSVDGSQFFQMLADVMRGETVLTPQMAAQMLTDLAQVADAIQDRSETAVNDIVLTSRQKEVLELVVKGYANKEIADQLGLTERTIKFHVSRILERYQLSSRYELSHLHQPRSEED